MPELKKATVNMNKVNTDKKQAEAEVVPSSSLVEIEVVVKVGVGVEDGVEVGVEVRVEVGVEVGRVRVGLSQG